MDGDKDVGAGGAPGHAVLGEASTGHHVMEVRVVLQLPAPGVQDTSATGESGPEEARGCARRLRAVADACTRAWDARR